MKRFFDFPTMNLMVTIVRGTVATATSESSGEIDSIMMSTPKMVRIEMKSMLSV